MKKRPLALLLALACTLTLAALPSPVRAAEDKAAQPYFKDEAEIAHLEAVTNLIRLGVMWGKEDGVYFAPKDKVTRGEAARLVALLLRGGKDFVASADDKATAPAFPDIQGHWAEACINYCAQQGVAFAQEDGSFDPNGIIGKYELLRMVEAALGYNDGTRDLTGPNWIVSVDSIAYGSGLYDLLPELEPQPGDRLDNSSLTRDEVAYILYAALNSAPYLGTEKRTEGNTLYFDKKYVLRPDGTPSTLLRENFGYDSWEDVPALPDKTQPEEQKPKDLQTVDPTAFTDAKDVTYWDAVATLTQLGIISGRPDGSFDGGSCVTRAEAAKMIAVLMNGGSEANTGAKKEPTFTDIQGHWAEGWIEYCADMAIVSGDGKGHFDPDGQVTVIQFYKMALTALGYDAEAYHLMGAGWAEQTLERAQNTEGRRLTEGLLDKVLVTKSAALLPASREVAAQILYNALLATPINISPAGQNDDGTVIWNFHPAKPDADGSRMTLFRQRFTPPEMPALPAQPTI